MGKMRFIFSIPVYNSEPWIEKCLESVKKQIYSNWIALIVGDPSTDETNAIIEKCIIGCDRFIFIKNDVRKYMIANRVDSIRKASLDDEDILIFLDGDDWLSDNKVLTTLNNIYADLQVWLTWGSHIVMPCNEVGLSASPITFPLNDVRKNEWYFSHLKTAKYFLWKNIKDEDFRNPVTRYYYQTAGDLAYMYPMLEMAGDLHCRFVDKILYIYNYENPIGDQIFNRKSQIEAERQIRESAPYTARTKKVLIGKNEK